MSDGGNPTAGHFDEMTCLMYLEQQLDEGHAREISTHAAACTSCRELLRTLQNEGVWLRRVLTNDDEAVPAHLVHAPERGAASWGWIAALGLACGGAYTVWSSIIEPWQAQAAQAGFTQGNLLTMLFFSGAFWKGWETMRSLIEFLSTASLGIVVIWLLQRHWRRLTMVAVVMGALFLALGMSAPAASAGEVKHGDPNYELASGEVVKTDLIVYANSTRIDGDVDGDLIVWSRDVTVNGHVKGDIIAFAQEFRVNGQVDGSVRTFAQTFSLSGSVTRNVMSWTQQADFDEKSRIGGTVMSGGADIELHGPVAGDAMLFGDSIEIGGTMGGNVAVQAGRMTIGPTAVISGETKYTGRTQPEISSGAKLASPVQVTIKKRSHLPNYQSPRYYWHQVLFWGARFLFGLVLLLLAPGFFFDAGDACKKYAASWGFGLLFLCATPIAAVIVSLTIVGLGVGIATGLLYIIAVYSARVFVGAWLGELLLGAHPGVGAAIGRLALGLAIIQALVMVPFLGALVAVLAAVWGMGALVLAIHKSLQPQWKAA
jgi:cytoskeletal protein CcmA (bactofilin family)